MFQGKIQRVRTLIVNHAAISSAAMSAKQVRNYIQRGQLELTDPNADEVIPYDQGMLKTLLRQNGS